MSTIVCFVTFMLCYSTLADRQKVLDLGSQVCPYTNFCHTDAWKLVPNDTDDEPCCFPCSCDDDCWELDNCCPDKDFINTSRPPIVPCKNSYLNARSLKFDQFGVYYRVIDTCPVSESRSILEPKCNNQNITSLEDFTWVSENTGKIYQNIHCAKCHGIEETIKWQIQVTCFDIMTANFDNFTEIILSENCHISNTPPKDLQLITVKYACTNPKLLRYNSCNESGLMKTYDPALEIACEQSTWPFNLGLYNLDKNIFCLLCNQELLKPFQELCFSSPGGKDPFGPYTFIIDYTQDTPEKESNCGLDEMYDEFLGLCRKLWCPIGTAPFYGRCKQLVSKINGLAVDVGFYLDILWNQTSLFTFHGQDTIWSLIFAQFIEIAGLKLNCDICQKVIYLTESSEPDLVLALTFKFNLQCEYGLALAKVADMRGKVIEIHINHTVTVTLFVRSDKISPTWQWLNMVFYDTTPAECIPHFTLSFEEITCPKIELINTDFELFPPAKSKERDIFTTFFMGSGSEQNVTRVSVCLDNYISAMTLNCAPLSYRKKSVQMLLIQLFVLAVIKVYSNK